MTTTTHRRTRRTMLWGCRGAVAAAAVLVTTGTPQPVASGSDTPPPVAGKRFIDLP